MILFFVVKFCMDFESFMNLQLEFSSKIGLKHFMQLLFPFQFPQVNTFYFFIINFYLFLVNNKK